MDVNKTRDILYWNQLFFPGNLAPVLQLLEKQESLDELIFIIDNACVGMGSTAWGDNWAPTEKANCTPNSPPR